MICNNNLLFNVAAVYDNFDSLIRGCVCVCVCVCMSERERERSMDWRSFASAQLIGCGGNMVASSSSADCCILIFITTQMMYMYFYHITFLLIPFSIKNITKRNTLHTNIFLQKKIYYTKK